MELTTQQAAAIGRYMELQGEYPALFARRELRSIILDRERLEDYAREHGKVLGVAAETPYFLFLNDLVEQSGGAGPYIYSRVIHVGQMRGGTNVGVLAVIADGSLGNPGDLVLVEQERHATGKMETGIPRGFGEAGQDGPTSALRELQEETGFIGAEAEFLGQLVTDSGTGDGSVTFYRVLVHSRIAERPESTEAIRKVKVVSPKDVWADIRSGRMTDAFTIQALALSGNCEGQGDAGLDTQVRGRGV